MFMIRCKHALKVGKAPLRQIYRIKQLCFSVFVIPYNGHPGPNPRYAEHWAKYKTSDNMFTKPCNQSDLGGAGGEGGGGGTPNHAIKYVQAI